LAALYNTIVATNGIPGQSNADNIYPEPDLDKYGDRFKNSFFHNISNGYSLPVIFGDDFRLDPSKGWTPQLIDQGDNSLVQSDTDLAGNPRIYNGTVDLGAYELYHVDLSDLEVKVDGTAINLNFDPFITAYFTGLDEDAGNVTINPSTSYTDALVEISINGGGFISIAFDQDNPVPLKAGENIIKVRVRSKTYAELQQTYTLTILWGETRAAKPVADPPGGPVPRRTDVKLSTATAGANIFYTTDGSDPSDPNSNRHFYSSPITINGDVTIKAVAVRGGYLDSEVMVEHYTVVEPFAGGGTENDPFLIGDAGELLAFNKFQADYLDKHFRLVNDIVFDEGVWDEHVWWPVGNFNGTFDGNGHIIRGLVVDQGADVVGMFGTIGADGKVKNLHLEAVEVKGGNYVGGIAGIVDGGQVAGSSAVGAVRGHSFVGGLVGDNRGTVTGSYFSGSVTGSSDSVGGLLGRSSSKVTHSYSVGSVQGVNNVGGLVGEGQLMAGYSLEHSYAAVSVKGNERVGGLMGMGWPGGLHVTHSWASGDVQGVLDVGGLIGQIGIPVSYVYAVGAVSPNPQYEGETENFDGLTGRNAANAFSYGYSLGKVVGNVAGGLMGQSTFAMESMDWNNEANQQATSARPLRPCHCRTRWRCKEVM